MTEAVSPDVVINKFFIGKLPDDASRERFSVVLNTMDELQIKNLAHVLKDYTDRKNGDGRDFFYRQVYPAANVARLLNAAVPDCIERRRVMDSLAS